LAARISKPIEREHAIKCQLLRGQRQLMEHTFVQADQLRLRRTATGQCLAMIEPHQGRGGDHFAAGNSMDSATELFFMFRSNGATPSIAPMTTTMLQSNRNGSFGTIQPVCPVALLAPLHS
jgi:hypothetical protein